MKKKRPMSSWKVMSWMKVMKWREAEKWRKWREEEEEEMKYNVKR